MGKGKIKGKGSRGKRAPNRLEHLNTVPDVVDVTVEVPNCAQDVELRCVSTDTLVDVRITLSELPETCHVTSYSLRRCNGDKLKRGLEVVSLKPNRVALCHEPYTRQSALSQVRRFADLFTCANLLGPVAAKKDKPTDSWLADTTRKQKLSSLTPSKMESAGAKSGGMWEEPLLHQFYSYFSFSEVGSPVSEVSVRELQGGEAFVEVEVALAGDAGEIVVAEGREAGFVAKGSKGEVHETLVSLLKAESSGFRQGYEALMGAFNARNQFGNPPLGLRCNTWVAPPCLSGERGRTTPAEDAALGGSIGGNLSGKERNWGLEFARGAAMPGNNPAERVARDHRVFLLWSHFVDEAVVTAITGEGGSQRYLEVRRTREATELSAEIGSSGSDLSRDREAALVKGLLADENTIARDVGALAKVTIHFNGEVIEVGAAPGSGSDGQAEAWALEDEPALREGVQALNVHGLRRRVIHLEADGGAGEGEDSLGELLSRASFPEGDLTPPKLRWELVFSWVQHLKEKEKASSSGLRRTFRFLGGSDEGERALREAIGEERWNQLAKLNLGLHRCTLGQLMDLANRFYSDVALAKIVSDFESLELSPIDGQTLTDFMHSRGINMRFLGRLATMSRKNLIHIHHLCVQEMVVRSVKRIVRAILAGSEDLAAKASSVARLFNDLFGGRDDLWEWIGRYLRTRFGYDLDGRIAEGAQLAVLRDICKRCGVEVVARTYNFASGSPFRASDIVSFFPVVKCLQFQSTDARELLEQAKGLLDKGKLDDAVMASTSALSKIVAVCGSAQNACCANAFSLLAVVLYHTGDFVQAAVLQAKALVINEREFGLDHPDTIKSYGDLAVFYYRVGEVDLALTYVERALYLLHLCVGEQHPNTAATYINIAMMEESKGRVGLSLRYLQEALKINQRLLGGDHVQTAASYHAIAIALSLMEPPLYPLAVQHEQTCLQILEAKLGPDDLRTQDAIAWLDYFDLKAQEGADATECNIASKGHMSVKELMSFIGEEEKEKEKRKKKKAKKRSKTPDSVLKRNSVSSSSSSGEEAETSRSDEEAEGIKEEDHAPVRPARVAVRKEAEAADEEGVWVVVGKREKREKREKKENREKREKREKRTPAAAQKDPVLNPNAALFHPRSLNPNAKQFVPSFKK